MIVVVVIVPAIAVSVVVMIPSVVVLKAAAVAVPIAGKVAFPVVVRRYPARAGVGRTRPIAGMPFVVPSHRVPIALDPYKIRPWRSRNHGHYARRRRRSDLDPYGNLRVRRQRAGEQKRANQQQFAEQSTDKP